ncbi:MAG: zf-HC2 domain-containing protein [Bacteroidetes bacterium]|nr:zf-HC2 domain-containing protein [Bacteroidota bacterium]MCL5026383.1 zf-HC2 domain-containing protein [Chloroflexota bacterium]
MSCSVYRTAISRYLDEALSEAERRHLLAHVQSCSQCAATLAEYRALETVLRRAQGIHAPSFSQSWLSASAANARRASLFRSSITNLGLVSAGAIAAGLVLLLASSLFLFVTGGPSNIPPIPALAAIEPGPRAGAEDTGARSGQHSSPDTTAARASTRSNPDDMKVKASRPFAVGYQPAGQPARVPIYTSPTADLAVVYTALGDSLTRPGKPLDLSGTLPPEATVERVMIERAPAPSQAYYLEVVFALPTGTRYRLQEISADAPPPSTPGVAEEGTLLIAGKAWKYGYIVPRDPRGETVRVFRSTAGNRITNLEAAAPLDEMVQMLQYLR